MTFPSIATYACMIVLAWPARSAALAQIVRRVVVTDRSSCANCTIEIDSIATLGDTDGAGSLSGRPATVRVDALGRFWVLDGRQPPMVFRPDGSFLQRVGTRGQGPGEFLEPSDAIPLPGDSVLVVDNAARRATVVTHELRPARMVRLPARFGDRSVVIQWPRTVLVTALIPTPDAAGWPLHLVSFTADVARPLIHFGPDSGALRPDRMPDAFLQRLTPARNGGAWTADRASYRLTLWNPDASKARTIVRQSTWFVEEFEMGLGSPARPPPSRVAAISEDAQGRLWVFVNVAGKKWRDAWPNLPPGGREVPLGTLDLDKLHDGVVDVIDPQLGQVVATGSIDGQIIAALPNGRAATYALDKDDIPRIRILSLRIVRR